MIGRSIGWFAAEFVAGIMIVRIVVVMMMAVRMVVMELGRQHMPVHRVVIVLVKEHVAAGAGI